MYVVTQYSVVNDCPGVTNKLWNWPVEVRACTFAQQGSVFICSSEFREAGDNILLRFFFVIMLTLMY